MNLITYVKEAVTPGGTPSRYLVWVQIVLLGQVLTSVLPSPQLYKPEPGLSKYLLIATAVILIVSGLVAKSDKGKIITAYILYIVGLLVSTITISYGITSLSGIVYMLTWAMTLFVAERREYITFDLVTLFMVLMLISSVILLMFNPKMGVTGNWIVLAAGGLFTAVNIYLVYIDFGSERNFYRESRESFSNLDILSSKLSKILSKRDQLEDLLWEVAQECVPFLQLEECVIYLYDEDREILKQVAAFGGKSTKDQNIVDPINIKPGEGVVGSAFSTGNTQLVKETKLRPDYIVDDASRASELAVPIISNGEPIGVIDSEHSQSGYFKERHVQAFRIMAAFCGIKITEHRANARMQQAEQAKLEADRYKELDQLKNRFVTNISHDLKTPLSLIKAPAMQLQKVSEDPKVRKHADYILKNTEHLLRVVGQLLQLNRVDRGLNDLYIEDVEVTSLLRKIGSQYHGLAEKDSIDFRYFAVPATLSTDSFRLEQILHNLIHNAFRYTGPNGKISVEGKNSGEQYVFIVSDNGPGISPEIQNRVFDRFFKGDENNHEGTGIGLSLVHEYAVSLGGGVQLNKNEGEGTTFTVFLPFEVAAESPEKNTEEELESDEGKPILLVVEDHADLNDFICDYFEDRFCCKSAFDGTQALNLMEQQVPDIILSDLMMPEMDGSSFVRKIRETEKFEHIPIVVLSAKSQVESRIDLYELGADNYLMKPFDISELNAVVHGILEQRKKLRNQLHRTLGTVHDMEVAINEEEIKSPDLIDKARQFVLNQIDNTDLSVPDLAAALGYGRNRFQTEIRETTGLSPVEFIRSVRLVEARKILSEGNLSVSQVAYSVGFNNLSYFTRSFKAEFDMLPSEV